MPSDADILKALTSALQDSLMVVAPPGWAEVELEVVSTPEGLRVKALSAKGQGGTQPPPRPPLNIDLKEEATRLGEGLTELTRILANHGKSWEGGKVQVVRGKDFTDWKLLLPDGSVRWFTRLLQTELEALVFTDDLFDLLRGTERAFHSLQGAFSQKLGSTTAQDYSEEDQLLSLTGANAVVRAHAQLIGSYSRENFLWVWGWAVEELAPACCEKVRRVCAPETLQPGLSALWRDHFHCDEGFAWALAAHVTVAIGARGLVRAETPGQPVILLYAVMENPA
ncbi:MAG: hypothetical protein H6Q89_32 [Myxococcaceae bacterium]|nr:hypothetical protein [Myxococcaceae bacterium]